MIEDLIPVAKDIHSFYNFFTNGGLETHMYEIPTIPRELIFELIRDKEYAEECAKKRDESFISLLSDNRDISLPPSL